MWLHLGRPPTGPLGLTKPHTPPQVPGTATHPGALDRRGASSWRTPTGLSPPGWPCHSSPTAVVWARLSSVWPIRTAQRGHQLLLQTKILLTCSSPPTKSKTAGQEKGREAKSRLLCHSLGGPATPRPCLPPLPAPCESSQGEHEDRPRIPPRGTREKADLFSHTVQCIFPSIPFHFAAIQVCSTQLFSLKYQTLQRGEKKKISLQQ